MGERDIASVAEAARRRLAAHSQDASAHHALGDALIRLGNGIEGLEHLMQAIVLGPEEPEHFLTAARALRASKLTDQASRVLGAGLEKHPTSFRLLEEYADLLIRQGHGQRVQEILEASVRSTPEDSQLLALFGRTLAALGDTSRALQCLRTATDLSPDDAQLWDARGTVALGALRWADARTAYQRAIELDPNCFHALVNLADCDRYFGDLAEAEAHLQRARCLEPAHPAPEWNLAHLWLLQEDWHRGFEAYEARRRLPELGMPKPSVSDWQGEAMPGQTLLVQAEQGLGDTLQFCRYLAPLRRIAGARIVFQAQDKLLALLASCDGIDALVGYGDRDPDFHRRVDLMSLPWILRDRVPVPMLVGGYLRPPELLLEQWRQRMPKSKKLRVALAWQGNPRGWAEPGRSVPFEALRPLFSLRDSVEFVIVQKIDGRDALAQHRELGFVDLDQDTPTFEDTAAALLCSDLLISSDTSTAHLGGALGVETWLMTRRVPDWRWSLEGSRSKWYPSVQLFRQTELDDWGQVVAQIMSALQTR